MNSFVVYNLESLERQVFEVSELEVQECNDTRNRLVKALDLEIIYDQIIEAYWDYKNKVNYWNLRSVSTPFADYTLNHEIRSSLNRLAFNLLNLSKLYLDWHFNESKKRCFAFELTADKNVEQAIISQRREIFDSNLNYAVGCNLRSHSQHSALPVRTFTTGVRYDHETYNRTAHFSIFYGYEELANMGVPKKRISKDIQLDLTDIIDGYVYAISQKHMLNRELTDLTVSQSRTAYVGMWQELIDQTGFKTFSSELHTNTEGPIGFSLEWFEVYDYLKSKHRSSIDYSGITFEK
ncbi:hypothetical protein L4D08_00355 [Photobacterium chitinilyticum]|uniref:hypothetical protein n=1 Tax=Photobacterium chitinilyticum TaxID=2485123 RepID=UPI003D0A6171